MKLSKQTSKSILRESILHHHPGDQSVFNTKEEIETISKFKFKLL